VRSNQRTGPASGLKSQPPCCVLYCAAAGRSVNPANWGWARVVLAVEAISVCSLSCAFMWLTFISAGELPALASGPRRSSSSQGRARARSQARNDGCARRPWRRTRRGRFGRAGNVSSSSHFYCSVSRASSGAASSPEIMAVGSGRLWGVIRRCEKCCNRFVGRFDAEDPAGALNRVRVLVRAARRAMPSEPASRRAHRATRRAVPSGDGAGSGRG